MKIVEVKSLRIEAVKVIRFGRFRDERGYFTEHYRKSDFDGQGQLSFMKDVEFVQANESYSVKGTIRGLHFQWNPYVGKLVRAVSGRMVDMALDIRKGSADFGKIILYDIPARLDSEYAEWIWLPPGFAHGNLFPEDSVIEYMCSGEYSPGCEAGISPMASDIDWSLCDPTLRKLFEETAAKAIITDKDRDGLSMEAWGSDERSENFIHGKLGDA